MHMAQKLASPVWVFSRGPLRCACMGERCGAARMPQPTTTEAQAIPVYTVQALIHRWYSVQTSPACPEKAPLLGQDATSGCIVVCHLHHVILQFNLNDYGWTRRRVGLVMDP